VAYIRTQVHTLQSQILAKPFPRRSTFSHPASSQPPTGQPVIFNQPISHQTPSSQILPKQLGSQPDRLSQSASQPASNQLIPSQPANIPASQPNVPSQPASHPASQPNIPSQPANLPTSQPNIPSQPTQNNKSHVFAV
jgi:hypothetical protein